MYESDEEESKKVPVKKKPNSKIEYVGDLFAKVNSPADLNAVMTSQKQDAQEKPQ